MSEHAGKFSERMDCQAVHDRGGDSSLSFAGRLSTGNPQLNWVLNAYQNPDALPGESPSPAVAAATMRELKALATRFARAHGVRDPGVPEDALGDLLTRIAQSNILVNFRRANGKPRHYINAMLWRFVSRETKRSRLHPSLPCPQDWPDCADDPARTVELRELIETCEELLGVPLTEEKPVVLDLRATARYSRTHRERRGRWRKVRHLFPEMSAGRSGHAES